VSMSPVATPRDSSVEPGIRLTVVTVADILKKAPSLAKHLSEDTSVSVVSYSGLKQIVEIYRQPKPCLIVADTSFLSTTDLAEFANALDLEQSLKILIVVDEDDPRFCQKLLRMGLAGAIHRSAPAAVFRRALDAVTQGELWASRKTISALVQEFLSEASSKRLTIREKEILGLVASGRKNREIADALFVSHETVRWHLRGIYGKLGVTDRKRAIEYALVKGMSVAPKPNVGEERRKAAGRAS
jgi:DNA-binding NarL/FixJ family response regulator